MKTSLLLLLVALTLSACTVSKNRDSGNFTKEEKAMIDAGKADEAMRVFIINNPTDLQLLRQKSSNLNPEHDQKTIALFAKRLEKTMVKEMGVGIAAPQVGILKNMICVQRFDREGFPNQIIINPVITYFSEEKQPCLEGCLSIPGRSDTTYTRALTIKVSYYTLQNEQIEETVSGFTAVIFQHEIDHLHGILYIDHLKKEMESKRH
ncbi:peptide deformylase [bacterium]|nr:peptide deformylase [bacterium]